MYDYRKTDRIDALLVRVYSLAECRDDHHKNRVDRDSQQHAEIIRLSVLG